MASAVVPTEIPSGTSPIESQVTSPAMPQHRADAFRHAIVARLRAGADVATLLREQQALEAALKDPAFLNVMAVAFSVEMKNQEPNAAYTMKPTDALAQIKEVLENREVDERGFIAMLSDPAFVASVQAEAKQPAPAQAPFKLPEEKGEDVIRRLVQAGDVGGPEPSIHVGAAALGHRIVHQALADMFKTGIVSNELLKKLTEQCPDMKAGDLLALAQGWLTDRHNAAHEIAKGLAPEGALYQEAMRQAATLHDAKIAKAKQLQPPVTVPLAPTKTDAPALAPAAQVAAPTQPSQKLAVQPSIAMEV